MKKADKAGVIQGLGSKVLKHWIGATIFSGQLGSIHSSKECTCPLIYNHFSGNPEALPRQAKFSGSACWLRCRSRRGKKIQALLTPISSVTVNEMCNNHTREHYQLLTRMRQLPMSWPARWSHTLARGGGSRCSAECRILQRKQPCNEEKVQQWDFFLISKVSVFIDIYFSSETSLGGHTPKHWWLLPQSFTLTSVLFRCATMSTSS